MPPSVFDSGGAELAARDLDVESGMDQESGWLPDIWDAHVEQRDSVFPSDVAAVSGEGDNVEKVKVRERPANWDTMSWNQRKQCSRRHK